jgi:hypothetical protein
MRCGLSACTVGNTPTPRFVVDLGAAEEAGREALAVVAQATSRPHIGTGITPLARRRAQVLANTVACLDRLSEAGWNRGPSRGAVLVPERSGADLVNESAHILRIWAGVSAGNGAPRDKPKTFGERGTRSFRRNGRLSRLRCGTAQLTVSVRRLRRPLVREPIPSRLGSSVSVDRPDLLRFAAVTRWAARQA